MKIIPEKLQNLWSSDEVRILVLTSLGIQIGLIFLAPLRKHNTNMMLVLTLWLLYVTADSVATLGIGNISRQTPAEIGISGELTVLWAPFLLVHLGGPDTIVSYSIEDNELWWRHLWGLVFQVIITLYVFFQSPPTGWLWIPTIFVFIPGLIKFAERTHALRLASKDNIKDKIMSELRPLFRTIEGNKDNTTSNPVPANGTTEGSEDNTTLNPVLANRTTEGRWGNLMGKIKAVLFPAEVTIDDLGPPFPDISTNESKAILEGFCWINIFKCMLVDVTFPADLLWKSQDRFSNLSSTDALKLVAIELSFLYDVLHTKALHMHCILSRVLRYFSLVSIIAALIVFHHLDKKKYVSGDIIITYILFGVGLSLEVIATILHVFSDWTVVALTWTEQSQCVVSSITSLAKGITLKKGKPRWAHTIGHFNLVDFCLRDRDTVLAMIMRILKIKHIWDNMRESRLKPLLPGLLQEIMVNEATRRASNVHIYNVLVQARSYRGRKALERHNQLMNLDWSLKREFDECIVLWHLATDICYYNDFSNQPEGNNDNEREVSWKTSNYMVYLLTQQQSMMQLRYGKTRFEATCAVVKKIFQGKGKLEDKKARKELEKYEVLLPVQSNNKWANWICWSRRKGEEDKHRDKDEMGEFLLKNCRRLAKELQKLKPEIKWKLISETWIEMLGYAAIHCNSYQHAKSLSRGGELLTHLWLLMVQLGVVEEHKMVQFQPGSVIRSSFNA